MCWSMTASVVFTGAGAAATFITLRQGRPPAIPLTIGYFTAMEALQVAGYVVVDQCGVPANQVITILSLLHIIFQPFFINAFAMELCRSPVRPRLRILSYGVCGIASCLMLLQLYPFDWAGACLPGTSLCGSPLCTTSGEWHIAWQAPFNGLFSGLLDFTGWHLVMPLAFPSYFVAAFLVPLVYGAWRFVVFHAAIGPVLATMLTDNPNEMPAIWCFFSIGIVVLSLSPWLWRTLSARES